MARKIQPTIIFIDEIDSFLRSRQSNDHEVTAMMKAEFMSLWDGLTTDDDARIVVSSWVTLLICMIQSLISHRFVHIADSWSDKQAS